VGCFLFRHTNTAANTQQQKVSPHRVQLPTLSLRRRLILRGCRLGFRPLEGFSGFDRLSYPYPARSLLYSRTLTSTMKRRMLKSRTMKPPMDSECSSTQTAHWRLLHSNLPLSWPRSTIFHCWRTSSRGCYRSRCHSPRSSVKTTLLLTYSSTSKSFEVIIIDLKNVPPHPCTHSASSTGSASCDRYRIPASKSQGRCGTLSPSGRRCYSTGRSHRMNLGRRRRSGSTWCSWCRCDMECTRRR
jgi:hypothetical protein